MLQAHFTLWRRACCSSYPKHLLEVASALHCGRYAKHVSLANHAPLPRGSPSNMRTVLSAQTCRLQATLRLNCGDLPNVLRISTVRRSEASFGGCERTFTRCRPSVHGGKFTFGCRVDAYEFRCGFKRLDGNDWQCVQFDGGACCGFKRLDGDAWRCVRFDGGNGVRVDDPTGDDGAGSAFSVDGSTGGDGAGSALSRLPFASTLTAGTTRSGVGVR